MNENVKTCRGPECERPVKLKGLCASHGQQLWRHGGYEAALIPIGSYVKPSHEGCDFSECERRHYAKGLCLQHYKAQWAGRELKPIGERRDSVCEFSECERRHYAKGLCKHHYRQNRNGQELRPIRKYTKKEEEQA